MDDVVKKCIGDIWHQYDPENTGYLNRDQAKLFVKQTLTEFVGKDMIDEIWQEATFEAAFTDYVDEEEETISKADMSSFIKKVADM